MSEQDEDTGVTVEVEALPPAVSEAEPAPEVSAEEGIERLRASLEAEKAARAAIEAQLRAARDATREAENAARAATAAAGIAEQDKLGTLIEGYKRERAARRAELAAAMAAADYGAASEIQDSIADIAARQHHAETALAETEWRRKNPPPERVDPAETMARQLAASNQHREAAWIRAHPEYASGSNRQRLERADFAARGAGHDPGTEGYILAVERALGLGAEPEPPEETRAPVSRRSAPVPEVPVSRGTGGASRAIRLTPEQIEMAGMMGMDVADYAASLAALKREGAIR